jgi:MOSC domain-containing protein YiiM
MWNGKKETTGINKKPTSQPVFLGKEQVKGDEVSDRKHHGGIYKACYLFSADHYDYWQKLYPNLNWTYGMFGENLTVSGLDETQIRIGELYKIGDAIVQITQPREPCYKFGVKFGTQTVLKRFIEHGCPGTYVSVIQEGFIEIGDKMKLIKAVNNSLTTAEFFEMLFAKEKNQEHLRVAIENKAIPLSKREKLRSYLRP